MHVWRRKLVLCISYKMKYLRNEARKQKSVKEVTLQFSIIFQIRLKITPSIFESYAFNLTIDYFVFIKIVQIFIQTFTPVSSSQNNVIERDRKP
jgi:hypothetical protein